MVAQPVSPNETADGAETVDSELHILPEDEADIPVFPLECTSGFSGMKGMVFLFGEVSFLVRETFCGNDHKMDKEGEWHKKISFIVRYFCNWGGF